MIRPPLHDEGDLAMLELQSLTPLEVSLLQEVRWYRWALRRAEHLMANAETIEEAFSRFEDLDASVF